MVSGFHEVVKW